MKTYQYRAYNGVTYARRTWVQRWWPFILAGIIAIALYLLLGDIIMWLWDLSKPVSKIIP